MKQEENLNENNNFGFQIEESSLNVKEEVKKASKITKKDFPEWFTKEDLENLNNDNVITLSLISNNDKEYLFECCEKIFKDKKDLEISFPIHEKDIDFNNKSNNVILQKILGLSIGKKSVRLNFTILSTIGEPHRIKELLFTKFYELSQTNETTSKNVITLDFKLTENNLLKYLCGKNVVLTAIQLKV